MICFLFFVYYMFGNDNKSTNVDQMCHILILLQQVQHAMSLLLFLMSFGFFFLRPALKPYLPDVSTTPHISWHMCFFLLQDHFKKENKKRGKKFASSSTAVSFSCPGCSRWSSQQLYYCNLKKDNRRMK